MPPARGRSFFSSRSTSPPHLREPGTGRPGLRAPERAPVAVDLLPAHHVLAPHVGQRNRGTWRAGVATRTPMSADASSSPAKRVISSSPGQACKRGRPRQYTRDMWYPTRMAFHSDANSPGRRELRRSRRPGGRSRNRARDRPYAHRSGPRWRARFPILASRRHADRRHRHEGTSCTRHAEAIEGARITFTSRPLARTDGASFARLPNAASR